MDLSSSHGGVNNNFYVTYPHQPNCGINCYCDSGATGGCAEIDFTENNGGCYQASTWHEDPSGGDKSGHGGSGGMSGGVVRMKATYSNDGNRVDVQIGGNHYGGNGLASQMSQYGAVIYSSQWVGWVPGNCGGDGNLQASSFAVSDVKITGRVVQEAPWQRAYTYALEILQQLSALASKTASVVAETMSSYEVRCRE